MEILIGPRRLGVGRKFWKWIKSSEKKVCDQFWATRHEDVHVLHNDALVIQARVEIYEFDRVFVDYRSSVNIIFQEAFDQMDFQGYKLELIETAIFVCRSHCIPKRGNRVVFNSRECGWKEDCDEYIHNDYCSLLI